MASTPAATLARLDSLIPRETPEGASLLLRPAGAIPRGAAWAVDAAIRVVIYWIMSLGLALAGKAGMGLLLILAFTLEFFYPVVFEVWRQGITPGKRYMGLAVVMQTGAPVTVAASLTRNLLRIVDFLPFGYLFGVITTLLHGESRRLGDIAAGTLVVYATRSRATPPQSAPREAIASRLPLQREELQMLAEFNRRADTLTPARQQELALLLPPLTAHAESLLPAQRVEILKAIGEQAVAGRTT
jgi:uncharacterized RDD family membrane protein YckC